MNPDTTTQDPEAIERDIRRTQEDMSRTVDKIGDQLTVKNVFNALLDKADESGVDAHYLVDGARRNPMALGLIAAGLIWLVSEKDSRFPSIPTRGKKPQAGTKDEFQLTGDLTIRGVTRPIALAVTFEGEGTDPWGGTRASFSAQGKFDRRDFGLTWNVALETGGILVSNEVKINIEAQVVAQA